MPKWNKKIFISNEDQRKAHFGKGEFWNYSKLADSSTLSVGQEIGLANEYFYILFKEDLDEMVVRVDYMQSGINQSCETCVKLIRYKNKNQYTYPVKGVWQLQGNFDCLLGHRGRYSDEFSFDLIKLDDNHLVDTDESRNKERYIVW